jgi:hypothetical protein
MMGAKPVSEGDLARVEKVVKDLRIDPDVAMDVFAQVRRYFECVSMFVRV